MTEALKLMPPASARQHGTRGPRVAIDVHEGRADFLLLAASPGQVLVGASTERMAGADLPRSASLKNLGAHRLADLGSPVAVFQVVHPKLQTRFPPLSTLDAVPGNLSVLSTHLVGRAREIDAVVHQLRDGGVRILTLTGPGGTGKTRLALHAAARLAPGFVHGAWFVDLAVVRRPAELAATIAAVVGLREVPGDSRPAAEVLVDFLAPKRLLLVLDNFEHLLEAAPTVAALAGSCPRVAVVVTSREPLHVRGEQEYPVPPLGSAPADAPAPTLTGSESVRLFVERARAVSPEFSLSTDDAPVAAAICERIDRLPLAIELAAAWVKVLPPRQILDRLSHRLDMLNRGTNDLPDRQRTLRTEIAWSYDLLEPAQQRLFRRLSVFPGGCTVDAAEAVSGEPGVLGVLAALVDKNLLRQSSDGASVRFWMLQTIREYAGEQLEENGESGETTRGFVTWALDLAEAAAPRLLGSEQVPSLDRLEAERDNLEEALRIMDRQRRVGDGARTAGALGWFWFRKGRFTTGARWLELFLGGCDESAEPGALAQAHYHLGWMRLMLGSSFAGNAEALASFRTALALHREAHDARGEALCTTWAAWLDVDLPMNERAALADRGVDLARRSADPWALSFCLKIAYSYLPRADQTGDQRTAALDEAIRLARGAGDPFLVCQALHGMGDVYLLLRDDRSAEPWYLESLERADAIGDTWSAFDARSHLAWGYLNRGEAGRARTCFADALRAAAEAGARAYLGQFLHGLATIERNEGRPVRSLRLGGAASAFRYYGQDRRDPRLTEGTGLPRDDVEKEWILGSLMSPDDAVRYALGTTT